MNENNEPKEETRILPRTEAAGSCIADSDCSGESRSTGSTDEYQQIGSNRANGESVSGRLIPNSSGEANIGGMLRQLREIHQDYLAYIETHTERLKARLAEDDERRQEAIRKIERLEQAIIERFDKETADDVPNP